MTKAKICGITNAADAKLAVSMGYDYIGMVFYGDSPRAVSAAAAKKITEAVRGVAETVGVFVDADTSEIVKLAKKLTLSCAQLHGNESPEYCADLKNNPDFAGVKIIKALRVADESVLAEIPRYADCADFILLDTFSQNAPGGTGETFNWDIAAAAAKTGARIILAGGLNADNVPEAVEKVTPYAVDVSSSVERLPRRKDYDKMLAFIKAVRKL